MKISKNHFEEQQLWKIRKLSFIGASLVKSQKLPSRLGQNGDCKCLHFMRTVVIWQLLDVHACVYSWSQAKRLQCWRFCCVSRRHWCWRFISSASSSQRFEAFDDMFLLSATRQNRFGEERSLDFLKRVSQVHLQFLSLPTSCINLWSSDVRKLKFGDQEIWFWYLSRLVRDCLVRAMHSLSDPVIHIDHSDRINAQEQSKLWFC